jgi:hypothetical protein
MDPGQVTYLLSWAHTYLWEREGLLLSCHGLRLFPDRLIRGGDRWRSKHCIKGGPQVWGLGLQVWTRTWNPWQKWNGLVSLVPRVRARRVFFGVPSWAHWFANCCFYVTVRLDYTLAPSKNWQLKDGEIVLIAQPLLDSRLGAYIEYWIINKIWLLKV